MAFKTIRYGKGRGSVEIPAEYFDVFLDAVRSANAALVEEFEQATEELEQQAQADWPVRQKRYGRSKDSKHQFTTGLRIIPPDRVQAFTANTAPYAWAIYAGADGKSKTTVPPSRRVAQELLWSPAKHKAAELADRVGGEVIKKVRRKVQ
jgi:hypothetical protein